MCSRTTAVRERGRVCALYGFDVQLALVVVVVVDGHADAGLEERRKLGERVSV